MLDISKFELIIFDFDGVIADSLGAYRELDRLVIKDLYGVDERIEEIEKMSEKIKTGAINNSENDYYRFIDQKYGDGCKSLDEIWGKNHFIDMNTVDVYVGYLRTKIAELSQVEYIRTVRGVGYMVC